MASRRMSGLPTALALVAVSLALGCGGSRPAEFGDGGTPPLGPGPGADAGSTEDATIASAGDGATLMLGPRSDAAEVTKSVCTAGVYQGSFMTYVGGGTDGGSPGLFSLMWNGNLTIDLQARKIVVMPSGGNGESFTMDTSQLEIAEGGALDGGDTMGGSFFANLDGQLDCDPDAGPPYHLQATLSNGVYKQPLFMLQMYGHLSADYQASTPPMLVNGQITVYGTAMNSTASVGSASGTWTATWVSP
jgi:hypothetical protein